MLGQLCNNEARSEIISAHALAGALVQELERKAHRPELGVT